MRGKGNLVFLVEQHRYKLIMEALAATGWNVRQAAKRLGCARSLVNYHVSQLRNRRIFMVTIPGVSGGASTIESRENGLVLLKNVHTGELEWVDEEVFNGWIEDGTVSVRADVKES